MQITYFRSSSYNCWSICPQQYFISYSLGIPDKSGRRAEMGTIFHKVMEGLANAKLAIQNEQESFHDDVFGEVKVDEKRLRDPEFVEWLFEKSFAHYTSPAKSIHKYYPGDKRDIWMWCCDSLDYYDGMFDPRKRDIVAAEPHFDLPIDEPWAKYDYEMPDGKRLSGQLRIKGTIDLVTKIDDKHYEVVDWKGLPIDTPIPTPQGWTTMGEISVGDKVFDQNGVQCNVVGKSTVKEKPCYTIMFNDGSSVTCDEDHLWKLDYGAVVNVRRLTAGDKIPVTKPLVIDDVELPVSPYVLGTCLINAHSSIPAIYLRSSYKQRLELLHGILAISDVNSSSSHFSFEPDSKQLYDNVMELLLSLGQVPSCYDANEHGVRTIIKIESAPSQPTQCIKVDSPDNTYLCTRHMIPTHNTGECKDWASGKQKDYDSFCTDPQLRMYYLALKRLYPHIDTITMTINYVRTAGPFTVAYSEEDIKATLNMLRKRFEQIKSCVRPKLKSAQRKHWFCQRVCWYGKNPHPKDGTKTICEYIADKTRQCGLNNVIREETHKGHSIDYYHDPGS